MKWLFIVDGGPSVGLGHLARSSLLARELVRRGETVILAIPEEAKSYVDKSVLACQIFCYEIQQLAHQVETLLKKSATIDAIVVDSYRVDAALREHMKSHIRMLVSFDDLMLESLYSDVIINASPGAIEHKYREKNPKSMLLLGPEYLTINRRFAQNENLPYECRDGVLISMGGSDPFNNTNQVSMALHHSMDESVRFTVVYGGAYQHECLREDSFPGRSVNIVVDVKDMASIINHHRIAVIAAGSTVYECAASGVPFASVVVADNQKITADYFAGAFELPVIDMCNCECSVQLLDNFCDEVIGWYANEIKYRQISPQLKDAFAQDGSVLLADALMGYAAEIGM